MSKQKNEKGEEQLECERLCAEIYKDTATFVAQKNHLAPFIQAGRKLLNGPPLYRPPVLFIGYQPGGGVDARPQHIAAETHWPEEFEYLLLKREILWSNIQTAFPKVGDEREFSFLKRCVGMNAIFFRSPNIQSWMEIPLVYRRELENYSLVSAKRFIQALQPQKIVVIGRKTYRSLGGQFVGIAGPLPQAKLGSIQDIPAIVTYHLSGSRMSTETREAVIHHLREFCGYNQSLND